MPTYLNAANQSGRLSCISFEMRAILRQEMILMSDPSHDGTELRKKSPSLNIDLEMSIETIPAREIFLESRRECGCGPSASANATVNVNVNDLALTRRSNIQMIVGNLEVARIAPNDQDSARASLQALEGQQLLDLQARH